MEWYEEEAMNAYNRGYYEGFEDSQQGKEYLEMDNGINLNFEQHYNRGYQAGYGVKDVRV